MKTMASGFGIRVAMAATVAAACSIIVQAQSLTITEQGGRPFGGRVMGEPATGSHRALEHLSRLLAVSHERRRTLT